MNLTRNHIIILCANIIGLLLSGYLSYMNIWGPGCSQGFLSQIVSCGGPTKVLIWGLPTCVYGFGMYALIFIANMAAWSAVRPRAWWGALIGLSLAGILFGVGLMTYELFILKIQFTTLPACVYGLVLFATILITSINGFRATKPMPSNNP